MSFYVNMTYISLGHFYYYMLLLLRYTLQRKKYFPLDYMKSYLGRIFKSLGCLYVKYINNLHILEKSTLAKTAD